MLVQQVKNWNLGDFSYMSRNSSYPLSILSHNHKRNITILGKEKIIYSLIQKPKEDNLAKLIYQRGKINHCKKNTKLSHIPNQSFQFLENLRELYYF